jgi:hypothetical protein
MNDEFHGLRSALTGVSGAFSDKPLTSDTG